MSYSRKIQIPYPGSVARVVHLASTSGNSLGSINPSGKIPRVVVKVQAQKSSLKRKPSITKGGKSYRKKHTMRKSKKSKKSRKQTKKKKGKKSRKTRK